MIIGVDTACLQTPNNQTQPRFQEVDPYFETEVVSDVNGRTKDISLGEHIVEQPDFCGIGRSSPAEQAATAGFVTVSPQNGVGYQNIRTTLSIEVV